MHNAFVVLNTPPLLSLTHFLLFAKLEGVAKSLG
jgi:hypothetical protein